MEITLYFSRALIDVSVQIDMLPPTGRRWSEVIYSRKNSVVNAHRHLTEVCCGQSLDHKSVKLVGTIIFLNKEDTAPTLAPSVDSGIYANKK